MYAAERRGGEGKRGEVGGSKQAATPFGSLFL